MLRLVPIEADLYLAGKREGTMMLYRSRRVPMEPGALERLESRGVRELLVCDEDRRAYLKQVMQVELSDEGKTAALRFRTLYESRQQDFEEAYRSEENTQIINFADEFGEELLDAVCNEHVVMDELFELMKYDDTTYTHCVNVASYALILGWNLGIRHPGELRLVARGGLLHDIGKRRIRRSILQKAGPLSVVERDVMQEHPRLGFLDLAGEQPLSVALMAYQHHERMDGSGYPVGLTREEIHPWARICAVADVYHALTSSRPYRQPMSRADACVFLAGQAGPGLDEEVTRCWISLISNSNRSRPSFDVALSAG
ncbi:MAG: HD-GYP domain-containing protein [Planctomycetota bacterium]